MRIERKVNICLKCRCYLYGNCCNYLNKTVNTYLGIILTQHKHFIKYTALTIKFLQISNLLIRYNDNTTILYIYMILIYNYVFIKHTINEKCLVH